MRPRLYSLYQRRQGETRWTRISTTSYYKDTAVRVYQNILLMGAIAGFKDDTGRDCELRLRPIKIESREAK